MFNVAYKKCMIGILAIAANFYQELFVTFCISSSSSSFYFVASPEFVIDVVSYTIIDGSIDVLFSFRIFQFENFPRTRKRVLADSTVSSPDDDEAIVGMYVSLQIKDVPRHLFNSWKEKNDKLSFEHKVSVGHICAQFA